MRAYPTPGRLLVVRLATAVLLLVIAFPSDASGQFLMPLPDAQRRDVTQLPFFNILTEAEKAQDLLGSSGLQWLNDVAAGTSTDQAYIASSLISGAMGRLFFDVSTAQVIKQVGPEVADSAAREVLKDGASHFTRLAQNGGTVAARLLAPLWAKGGSIWTRSGGFIASVGGIGPTLDADKLDLAFGVTVESLNSIAIRDPGNSSLIGELLIGVRAGYRTVSGTRSIAADSPLQDFAFGQLSIGLRAGDRTLISALITRTQDDALKEFVPGVQLSLQLTGRKTDG